MTGGADEAAAGTAREAALDSLLDREALRDLAMRYCRAIDRRDMALLRTVYHPDAVDEHGTTYAGPVDGFVAGVCDIMRDFVLTSHLIGNTLYRLDGDRAEGELYFQAYHRTDGDAARHIVVLGRYLDRYERRGGEWRIAHRRLVWDSVATADVFAADAVMLAGLGDGGGDGDDPSYAMLPLLGRGG